MANQFHRNNEHGQTVAAWVLTIFTIIGSAFIAVGIFVAIEMLWIIGIAICILGALAGYVLHQAGYGQKLRK
jgi:uncharacterized membrane protein YphA (DoxX/SURF4 family)